MTVIVAVDEMGKTILGADRLTTIGDGTACYSNEGKIFALPIRGTELKAYVGHAGDVVARCILQLMTLPEFGPDGPDLKWAIAVSKMMSDAVAQSSVVKIDSLDSDSEGISCELLLCVKDRIYAIQPCEAMTHRSAIVAIGSGAEVAVGFLGGIEAGSQEFLQYRDVLSCIRYVCRVRTDCGLDDRPPTIVVVDHETGEGEFRQ